MSDFTIQLNDNTITSHSHRAEPWKVTLIDTGVNTETGRPSEKDSKLCRRRTFCLTYGDGLSNVNIKELITFHKKHGKLATVTAVQPPGSFGSHIR